MNVDIPLNILYYPLQILKRKYKKWNGMEEYRVEDPDSMVPNGSM